MPSPALDEESFHFASVLEMFGDDLDALTLQEREVVREVFLRQFKFFAVRPPGLVEEAIIKSERLLDSISPLLSRRVEEEDLGDLLERVHEKVASGSWGRTQVVIHVGIGLAAALWTTAVEFIAGKWLRKNAKD